MYIYIASFSGSGILAFIFLAGFVALKMMGRYGNTYNKLGEGELQVNGIPLGASVKTVIKAMGEPQRITSFESKLNNNEHYQEYHYGSDILQILPEGRLHGFNIKSGGMSLEYGGTVIKIGDDLTVPAKCFYNSYRGYLRKGKLLRVNFEGTNTWLLLHIAKDKVVKMETWTDV